MYVGKINIIFSKCNHYPAKIINQLQTNYDECLNYDIIQKFHKFTDNMTKKSNYTMNFEKNFTTHDLISYWMIITNNYFSDELGAIA